MKITKDGLVNGMKVIRHGNKKTNYTGIIADRVADGRIALLTNIKPKNCFDSKLVFWSDNQQGWIAEGDTVALHTIQTPSLEVREKAYAAIRALREQKKYAVTEEQVVSQPEEVVTQPELPRIVPGDENGLFLYCAVPKEADGMLEKLGAGGSPVPMVVGNAIPEGYILVVTTVLVKK